MWIIRAYVVLFWCSHMLTTLQSTRDIISLHENTGQTISLQEENTGQTKNGAATPRPEF